MDEDEKMLADAVAGMGVEDEEDTDDAEEKREDSPDPAVRNGGPFGGDEDEGEAWIKAFTGT